MNERIEQLERKCKLLTLAVIGMMVLAVGAVCIGAKPNSQKDGIQTNKLEILDEEGNVRISFCLLYTSPSPRDGLLSRMPSSA